ncbi:MAG: toll/interleukin-1 receptor domain-containing protein, partial [Sphingobacteriales bacterium]
MIAISYPDTDVDSFNRNRQLIESDQNKQVADAQGQNLEIFHKQVDESVFEKREKIMFIHAGIAGYKNIPSLQQPMYDGWTLRPGRGDMVFEGTDLTLGKVVNSFLYQRKSGSSVHGEQNSETYIKPYGPQYGGVIIVIFVKKITQEISNCITATVGIDVFGRSQRKLCVVAIPVENQPVSQDETIQRLIEDYVRHLVHLINYNPAIKDLLSVFQGSRHFAQREQYDGDGDEADMKQSLDSALKFRVDTKSPVTAGNEILLEKSIKEIKTKISNNQLTGIGVGEVVDELNCTVFAPDKIARGNEFLVQVFTHTYVEGFELSRIARSADDSALRRGAIAIDTVVLPGSKISFQLSIPGLEIDDDILSITWNGKLKCAQFSVRVPEKIKPAALIAKILVSHNAVPVGQIKFKIQVIAAAREWEKKAYSSPKGLISTATVMERFEKAFISYASQDRAEVLKRVQMLNLVKLDFFQDLLTLEPGDEWEAKIYDYINKCDVFFIFWSKAASESEWVKKETLHAYQLKKKSKGAKPDIIPVIIE